MSSTILPSDGPPDSKLDNKAVHAAIILIIIGVTTQRAGGLRPPVKDRHTLIEQSVTRINKTHRIIVKQVVYDEFMKLI